MNTEAALLQRYLDGDLSPVEAELFRARLAESPTLRRQLAELQRLGAALRVWSRAAEERAEPLLEPTLRRVDEQARKQARHTSLGYALAGALLVALPWASYAGRAALEPGSLTPSAAAIERVEATDQQAQVFVVGSSSTPVVWLVDDAEEDEISEQDPG